MMPRPPHMKIALARFGIQLYDPDTGHYANELRLFGDDGIEKVTVKEGELLYNPAWVANTPEREIETEIRETVAAHRILQRIGP